MTLSTTQTKVSYIPDGVETRFAVPYPFYGKGDLRCAYTDAAGQEHEITRFDVEGYGSEAGVYVRFYTPPAAGRTLVIYRETPHIQETDYPEGGKFPAVVVEQDFDRVVAMIQEIQEELDRALRMPISSDGTPEELMGYLLGVLEKVERYWQLVKEAIGQIAGVASNSIVVTTESTEPRALADRFHDWISVKDFGARGDGLADDTEAFQRAATQGKAIYVPQGIYNISRTITISNDGKPVHFFGVPGYPVGQEYQDLGVNLHESSFLRLMTGSTKLMFHVRKDQCQFSSIGFGVDERGIPDTMALRFERVRNRDDMDCYVHSCLFNGFGQLLYFVGRCLTYTDNLAVACGSMYLTWAEEGNDYSQPSQQPPYGNRAMRIQRNRFHSVRPEYYVIRLSGAISRSALITDNLVDVGSGLVYSDTGFEGGMISGNVCDMSAVIPIQVRGENAQVINTSIHNNTLSCFRSQADTSLNGTVATTMSAIWINCPKVENLQIVNNRLNGFNRRPIVVGGYGLIEGQDPATVPVIRGVNISNNTVEDCCYDTSGVRPCIIDWAGPVDGGTVANNQIVKCPAPYFMDTAAHSTFTLSGLHVMGNSSSSPMPVFRSSILQNMLLNCYIQTKQGIALNAEAENPYKLHIKGFTATPLLLENSSSGNAGIVFKNSTGNFSIQARIIETNNTRSLQPADDGIINLGSGQNRFGIVFAASGTINTSDEREKTRIEDLPDAVFRAWGKVSFKEFVFKTALDQKGDRARKHIGLIAQEVKAAFESEGVDPFAYGLLCYDEWEEQEEVAEWRTVVEQTPVYDGDKVMQPEIVRQEKIVVVPAIAAGNRYSLRYDEAMALEAAYTRRCLEEISSKMRKVI